MATKNALRLSYQGEYTSAGVQRLESDPVESVKRLCVQHAIYQGDKAAAGGNNRARLYIDRTGTRRYIAEQGFPLGGKLYALRDPFWVEPRERVGLEWDQAQANTRLDLLLVGYWVKADEGIVE